MKSILLSTTALLVLAGSASAADLAARMPYKAPLQALAPAYNWSGFYIGGHIGGAWTDDDGTTVNSTIIQPSGVTTTVSSNGVIGGGQLGFNAQWGNWVVGIEGDFSAANQNSSTSIASPFILGISARGTTDIDWYGTVAGRLGYAADNWLIYAKGGGAWMRATYTADALAGGITIPGSASSITDTRTGWMVGAGLEVGFWQNWSAKIEYNFMDFGTERYTFVSIAGPGTIDVDTQVHVVKAGINYRFNWAAPVVARY